MDSSPFTDTAHPKVISKERYRILFSHSKKICVKTGAPFLHGNFLLLDEATSSLYNISEKKIIDSVQQLSENMTVITIAHRLSTIQGADVIHVMRDGAIVESGAHDALMDKKGEYYQLYLGQEKEE